jgi:hypothetical protein
LSGTGQRAAGSLAALGANLACGISAAQIARPQFRIVVRAVFSRLASSDYAEADEDK